ncbi:hypothetical protein [Candidatus Avelusimicrobium fimicolum]|uniref:hypothetical protein n=1 Tax=Candidatus Avelusimicrobium fimicolum TaxID=3416216 RepID=UPI003D095E6F
MKKIIFFSASLLLFTAASAEELQFVTTISPPVGSFAHLDAADSTHVTTAPILNFCNTRSSAGKIAIKGAGAYLKQIDIQNGTALGSTNTPEYRLGEKLTIEKGGTVTAGRVMANQVTFDDTNYHKSNVTNTLYGNDVAVMGGKTDNMEISSTAKINKSAQKAENLGVELWWDNQYKNDYDASGNKKTNGKTYTSFLLKSKGGVDGCTPSADYKKITQDELWDLLDDTDTNFCVPRDNDKKLQKYTCPTNLTEKKECVDIYKVNRGGSSYAGDYTWGLLGTKFKNDHGIETDYKRQDLGIRPSSPSFIERFFPKEFGGRPMKGYMEYKGSDLWENYPNAVIIGAEGPGGNLPYAEQVDQNAFGKVCQERAPFAREKGYYLMYSGGHLPAKAPDGTDILYWYVIAAGICEVVNADQYYMANVTCCPQ